MTVIEGFELLTRVYLGQDWEMFGSSLDDAIANFVRDEDVEDVTAAIAGFEKLLATPMTEQQEYDRWIFGCRSGYDPRSDGLTFPRWFAHALSVLRAAAAAPG